LLGIGLSSINTDAPRRHHRVRQATVIDPADSFREKTGIGKNLPQAVPAAVYRYFVFQAFPKRLYPQQNSFIVTARPKN
jgi:hypothetical protein